MFLGLIYKQLYLILRKFSHNRANNIYEILGYKLEQIPKVGLLISEAYQLADKAEIARINGDNLEGLYLTYFLLKMGLAHNKRDLKMCEENGEKYWLILLKKSINFCPFLG